MAASRYMQSTFRDALHHDGVPVVFDLAINKFKLATNISTNQLQPATAPFTLSNNPCWDASSRYWLVQLRGQGISWDEIASAMPQLRTTARECQLEYAQMIAENTTCISHPTFREVGFGKILIVGAQLQQFSKIAAVLGDGRTAADCSVELYMGLHYGKTIGQVINWLRPLHADLEFCEMEDRAVIAQLAVAKQRLVQARAASEAGSSRNMAIVID